MEVSTKVKSVSKRLNKILLSPIEVYVFHAVSDNYDEKVNKKVDWTSTEEFKKNIAKLKNKYEFISLPKAYDKLRGNLIRRKRYAVLTCDDGFASIRGIVPFLEEQGIPVTLFINPKYLDGESKREGYAENPQYLTKEELWGMTSSWISIGMHGYEHNNAAKMTKEEFTWSVDKCMEVLWSHPRYIPFYAYTWGRYTEMNQQVLKEKRIVPVLTDGESNYRYRQGISRKPIDSYYLKKNKD